MKKILSMILAVIIMIMPLSVGVFASESDVNYDDLVAPCYDNISSVSAIISETALGFANCTSDFVSSETNRTFVLTCYLQRTDGESGWVNYKSKSETYTSKGAYTIDKKWYAPSGYAYRTYTKLQVKNSSGTVIETATVASSVLYKW